MSRTRRRKTVKTEKNWDEYNFVRKILKREYDFRTKLEDILSEDEIKIFEKYSDWQYHKDTRTGFGWKGHAPKSYRKCITESERAKDKVVTRDILKKEKYEEYVYNPWKKDAGYTYW